MSLLVTEVGVNALCPEEEDDDVMVTLEEGDEQRSHVPGVTKVGVSVRVLEQRRDKRSVTMTRRQVEGSLVIHHHVKIRRCHGTDSDTPENDDSSSLNTENHNNDIRQIRYWTKPRLFFTANVQTEIYNIRDMSELPRDQSVKDNPDNCKELRI